MLACSVTFVLWIPEPKPELILHEPCRTCQSLIGSIPSVLIGSFPQCWLASPLAQLVPSYRPTNTTEAHQRPHSTYKEPYTQRTHIRTYNAQYILPHTMHTHKNCNQVDMGSPVTIVLQFIIQQLSCSFSLFPSAFGRVAGQDSGTTWTCLKWAMEIWQKMKTCATWYFGVHLNLHFSLAMT